MNRIAFVTIACLMSSGLFASPAAAATHLYALSSRADTVYVGMVHHGGASARAFACFDGPNASDAVWYLIGTSAGLNGDYIIHGNVAAGDSHADTMYVLRAQNANWGDCVPDSGFWQALSYNGYALDVYGGAGNDTLYQGEGLSSAFGEAGNDTIFSLSSTGYTSGGAGSDNIYGYAGALDWLQGDADNDCLYDASNSWDAFDCGSGSDKYDSFNASYTASMTSCEGSGSCI